MPVTAPVAVAAPHTNRLRCCHRFIAANGAPSARCPRCGTDYVRQADGTYTARSAA